MGYNSSTDLWYQYVMSSDGSQLLILLTVFGFRAIWATFGAIFNFGIVYTTIKNRNLRSICNILIALESFFGIWLDIAFYVSFLVLVSGIKFIRYEYCFWVLIFPCICGSMAQFTMMCIAIDRMLAVAFPIWYKKRKPKQFLAIVFAFIFCYGTADLSLRYIDYTFTKDIMVTCAFNEMGQSFIGQTLKMNGLVLSGILMTAYSLCWFMVFKLKATAQNVEETNRKLIKALFFIIGLNLIGVFVRVAIDLTFQAYAVVNVFVKMPYSIAVSFFTITVYSANGPMLYIMSAEYRTRLNQQFLWLTKMFKPAVKNSIQVTACKSSTMTKRTNGMKINLDAKIKNFSN